ncbi:MAG: heme biosynthesis HemY N-terminal domain-containing protein [Pseudomonadota bacterium]
MIRGLIAFALVAALALFATWAADRPGRVTLNWEGWRIDTSVLALFLTVLALVALVLALSKIWNWLFHNSPIAGPRRKLRKQQSALGDVNRALGALAAGDPSAARWLAAGAIKKLENAPIAHVVAAQAAAAEGDEQAAEKHYAALAEGSEGKFIGQRGLINQARRDGRSRAALALAEDAVSSNKDSPWAVGTLFDLQAQCGDWLDAEKTLKKALRLKIFTEAQGKRHRAALLYGQAVEAETDERMVEALALGEKALKANTGFLPAVLLVVRRLKATGKTKRAVRLIEETWKVKPYPPLAESFAMISPTETADARYKRFQALTKLNPDHPESRMRLAEAALGADEAEAAKTALLPILTATPRSRAAYLMVKAEAALGADAETIEHWNALAASGISEPEWTCQVCGTDEGRWLSHCPSCGTFNSFLYDQPRTRRADASDDHLALVGGMAPPVEAIDQSAPTEPLVIAAPTPKPIADVDSAGQGGAAEGVREGHALAGETDGPDIKDGVIIMSGEAKS